MHLLSPDHPRDEGDRLLPVRADPVPEAPEQTGAVKLGRRGLAAGVRAPEAGGDAVVLFKRNFF